MRGLPVSADSKINYSSIRCPQYTQDAASLAHCLPSVFEFLDTDSSFISSEQMGPYPNICRL
jgi:hypothetical protein